MAVADMKALIAAMNEEANVTDADIERVMQAYHTRMDPRTCSIACGSCGVSDVPVSEGGPDPYYK